MRDMLNELEAAARALGVQLQLVEARGPDGFDGAFSAMTRERAGALIQLPSPMLFAEHRRIADLALKGHLPAIYGAREFVDAGGLMSYGTNIPDLFRRAATYVDKILKRGQARRSPRREAHQIRAGHQPQDGQGPGPDDPSVHPHPGG
jgi:putative ABC transport system substrate-binding protein